MDKLSWMVFFVCHASNFEGCFSIRAISKEVRSRKISGDQWRSMVISNGINDQITADHCGSWQIDRSDRSGACRQLDQTWQGVWLHNRDILSASCIVQDNTAVTFQKYIGFGVYKGLENPTQQNKKRGWSYRCPFFFFMNWYFYLCFCVICGNINTDSKKKLSAVCIGLTTFTFADTSQGNDITYHEIVKHISVHLYKSDQQSDEIIRPSLAHTHCQRIRRVFL